MFFDNLAGIVERHLPEFVGRLAEARIFRMEPRDSSRAPSEAITQWEPDQQTIENFRLPFTTVAFERARIRQEADDSCIVIWSMNEAEREFGYLVARGERQDVFLATGTLIALPDVNQVLEPKNMDRAARLKSITAWKGSKREGGKPVPVSLLWIGQNPDPLSERERGPLGVEETQRTIKKIEHSLNVHQVNLVNMNCACAVLSVLIVNDPTSFVVEERPLNPPRENPSNTIRRSVGRPHFIVLKPGQIRKRFLYPETEEDEESETRKVTPHERRGHYRKLESERFKNVRGQVIWIKPMWVGPQEAVRGPNKYTVRLDL